VVIDEFRLSGPGGSTDQYVELYNTGPAVSLAGFALTAASGASVTVPSSAPTLPTGHAYLIAGGGYSLGGVAAADSAATSLGSNGLHVTAPDGAATVVDAVGSVVAPAGFFAGTPLPGLSGSPTDQYAWVRLETGGVPVNTANNAADFALVSTTGGVIGGVQSTLGSPSPIASTSPTQANRVLRSTLLDTAQTAAAVPNRVYVRGTPGLLTVRRTITNSSGSTITAAEVRMTSLSEANGGPQPGVSTQPPRPAALRLVNPLTATSQVSTGGGVVTVQNLGVDAPADAGHGGGLNTTLSIPLPGGLAAGASVNIALTFAVDHGGTYWFGYDVDALGGSAAGAAGPRALREAHPTVRSRAGIPSVSRSGAGRPSVDAGGSGVLR
jgi:hypothetical protein